MRARSLEAMRHLFVLVLLTALFVAHLAVTFTTAATLSFALAHPFPFFSLSYG